MSRRSGGSPDPLRRLNGAPPAGARDVDARPPAAEPWGATALPAWLDTPVGRRAWERRDAPPDGFAEVLDDDADPPADPGRRDATGADDWFAQTRSEEAWDDERDWVAEDWNGTRTGDRHAAQPESGVAEELEFAEDREEDFDDDVDEDWAHPPRRRITMLPPAAIGLVVVGVLACLIAGYSLLRRGEPAAPAVAFPASAGPVADGPAAGSTVPGASSTTERAELVVSVAGLVHRPGLVRLPPDARVADALERAGGAKADADVLSLNLAQRLNDGDQVLVGRAGPGSVRSAVVSAAGTTGAVPEATGDGAGPVATGKPNLNTASLAELDALPGVGPVTAQNIISWREANGGFSSVDQLAEVDGIGPARLAKLRDLVTVG